MASIDNIRTRPLTAAEVKAGKEEATLKRSLRKGDSGSDVAELQSLLDAAGFPTQDKRGVFGDSTYQAVEAFQQLIQTRQKKGEKKMLVDGIVGPQTRGALRGLTGKQLLDPGFVKKDSYHAKAKGPKPSTHVRPTNEKICQNLMIALANRSKTDNFTVEDARRMADAMVQGYPPPLSSATLEALGAQALAAQAESRPKADYAYAGAQMTNGEFDALMTDVISDALRFSPQAAQCLWSKAQQAGDQAALQTLSEALNGGSEY